jgi:DNA-binding response OmpR family regulator
VTASNLMLLPFIHCDLASIAILLIPHCALIRFLDSPRTLPTESGCNTTIILSKGEPVRILIVEDDERIIGFMKRGLEAEEHEVDIASGKSQTVAQITTRRYDLIIIDIFLGPDDGLDICQTLRRQRVGSPILVMTAKGTPETAQASKKAGADAYLAKPFAFEDLLATLNHLHGSKKLSKNLQGFQVG